MLLQTPQLFFANWATPKTFASRRRIGGLLMFSQFHRSAAVAFGNPQAVVIRQLPDYLFNPFNPGMD